MGTDRHGNDNPLYPPDDYDPRTYPEPPGEFSMGRKVTGGAPDDGSRQTIIEIDERGKVHGAAELWERKEEAMSEDRALNVKCPSRGARVKLSEAGRAWTAFPASQHQRFGIVTSPAALPASRPGGARLFGGLPDRVVSVLWDGRKTVDRVNIAFLEEVPDAKP